jgi:hypothetical protein
LAVRDQDFGYSFAMFQGRFPVTTLIGGKEENIEKKSVKKQTNH